MDSAARRGAARSGTVPGALPVRHIGRRVSRRFARRAVLALTFCLAAPAAHPVLAAAIVAADYGDPTTRYPHGALGDDSAYGAIRFRLTDGRALRVRLPEDLVFEDTAPRLADLDGDGGAEVIVVESHRDRGARLAVWGIGGDGPARIAVTPFIGQRFRWLAPVGAADLDGDGRVEIAYVETPHLGRVLKIVRPEGGRLVPVAEAAGLTNHRFGAPAIEGRIATCGGRPTILTADAGWRRIVGTVLLDGTAVSRDLGDYAGPRSFARVAGCD